MAEKLFRISKVVRGFMIAAGIWRLELTTNKFARAAYRFYSVFFLLSMISFVITLIVNLPKFVKRQDFDLIVENIGYSITASVMLVKLIICRTSKIRDLVNQYEAEEKMIYKEAPEPIQTNFSKHVKVLIRLFLIFFGGTACAAVILLCAIYSEYSEYRHYNETVEKPVPFTCWYPFDVNRHYSAAVGLGLLFTLVAGICNTVTQVLFMTLMTYAVFQLKALQIYGRNFHQYCEPYDENDEKSKEKAVLACLRQIVIKHRSVISFVKQLNLAMRNVLLLEYLLNALNIAIAMVRILVLARTPIMLTFDYNYLMLETTQLFLVAWQANEIQLQGIYYEGYRRRTTIVHPDGLGENQNYKVYLLARKYNLRKKSRIQYFL